MCCREKYPNSLLPFTILPPFEYSKSSRSSVVKANSNGILNLLLSESCISGYNLISSSVRHLEKKPLSGNSSSPFCLLKKVNLLYHILKKVVKKKLNCGAGIYYQRLNTVYKGTDFILFSKPKFFCEMRIK